MTKDNKIDGRFKDIWEHFSHNNTMATATLEEIEAFAVHKRLEVKSIEEKASKFDKCVILETNVGSALYPRKRLEEIELFNSNKKYYTSYEHFWKNVDWFLPPFTSRGDINEIVESTGLDVCSSGIVDKKLIQKRFEEVFSSLYSLERLVPITIQTFAISKAVSQHIPVIKESILACYSGFPKVAIAALIPIVEAALRIIIGDSGEDLDFVKKVNTSIYLANSTVKRLHFHDTDWVPPEYEELSVLKVMNERIFMLETLRSWLLNSFYAKTVDYNNYSGFNRHLFAHAKSDIWQKHTNFFRAMGLLQALVFVECFAVKGNQTSLLSPTPNQESEDFYMEVIACINSQVFRNRLLSEMQGSAE